MQTSHKYDISVVVLSFNRIDELRMSLNDHCIGSMENGYEFIVVDNASTDGSRELLCEYKLDYPHLKVILNQTNLGVSGGRNSGYSIASGVYILSLDEDAHIKPFCIVKLKEILESLPMVGIISPKILHYITHEQQNPHGNDICEVGNFHGACYMFRQSLIAEIGYLDELCSFGGEELDYSIRVRSEGYSILYTPDVEARHNNYLRSGPIGNERLEKWIYNYVRIHYKYFPFAQAYLFSNRYIFSYIITCLRSRNFLVIPNVIISSIKGIRDGLRSRTLIPISVSDFYRNPLLRPDIGNIPVWIKIRQRVVSQLSINTRLV